MYFLSLSFVYKSFKSSGSFPPLSCPSPLSPGRGKRSSSRWLLLLLQPVFLWYCHLWFLTAPPHVCVCVCICICKCIFILPISRVQTQIGWKCISILRKLALAMHSWSWPLHLRRVYELEIASWWYPGCKCVSAHCAADPIPNRRPIQSRECLNGQIASKDSKADVIF